MMKVKGDGNWEMRIDLKLKMIQSNNSTHTDSSAYFLKDKSHFLKTLLAK